MNTIELAKQRVCSSLTNRVEHIDQILSETDLENDKDKIKRLYNYQTHLLNRLEKVLGNS